jgi:hypothetical protein
LDFFLFPSGKIMSETPSWLQSGNEAAVPSPSAPAPAPVGSMNLETNATTAAAATDVDDTKDLPSIILMMRLLNMGVAGAVITISVRTDAPWVKINLDLL